MGMEEGKKYAALAIPQRTPHPGDGAASAPAHSGAASAPAHSGAAAAPTHSGAAVAPAHSGAATQIGPTGAMFAEVEFAPAPEGAAPFDPALRFYSSITPAEPIAQRAADPIRQVFYEMRSLASDRPFARNDSELFYKQAKFMEDFTDDYEGDARFNMYYPHYQHMGYEHLRTYFTWRTKVRRGEAPPVQVSYVFLYIYELLSGVGVENHIDGLRKLVSVWDGFSQNAPALGNYMPKWLKDYHVYYELPHSFTDFVEEHGFQKYFPLAFILDSGMVNSLPSWNSLSRYDITKSRFYNDGNEQICADCFDAVIKGMAEFCGNRGAGFESLLVYRVSNKTPWFPFRQALFQNWLEQPDRDVILPCQERYYCRNNQWTASLPVYYSTQRDFASYLIKSTEMYLRQAVGYKYKLTVEPGVSRGAFRELKELDAKNTDIDRVIEQSVAGYYGMLTRTVVTVDHENLARIREESLGTQGRLIVPEDGAFDETVSDAQEPTDAEPDDESYAAQDPGQPINPWLALKDALGAIEIEALTAALRDSAGVKAIAMERGIMLEILADGINEKAADLIGDSILEIDGGMVIYDEYVDNIREIITV